MGRAETVTLDTIVCGDCLDVLPTIQSQSVDAVITDPPYPCIKRDYGYWSVETWWALVVEGVIPEVRRILKPTGSAVFILQPNSEKVGKMRGWLWEFMAWVCREWNMIQDVWWWNYTQIPNIMASMHNLLRPSVRACIWSGEPNCFKNQEAVLWEESQTTRAAAASKRWAHSDKKGSISGYRSNTRIAHQASERRGGVTPYNMLPVPQTQHTDNAGKYGHGAGTPLKLITWWIRYIVPRGGLVVDPFMGSGTAAVAAIQNRCHFFGCDTKQEYVDIANERIAKARLEMAQIEMDFKAKEPVLA